MTDFIDGLERDLVDAARRRAQEGSAGARRGRVRGSWRSLLLVGAILTVSAGSATAGTLLVLRGSVIPAPSPRDVPPEQTPVPESVRIAELRAKDPAGAPPWAIRVAASRTGYVCSTVGQVVGGQFGLVGLDRRFRRLSSGIVDSCGQRRPDGASLVGARVFDAPDAAAVRTVVNGVGGEELRSVTVEAGGERRQVAVGQGGVFVTALRGYPEDLGIRVTLRFTGGKIERHPFGTNPFVVADPAGGRAWKIEALGFGQPIPARCRKPGADPRACRPDPNRPVELCARFRPAREMRNPPFSEAVCGRFPGARQRTGYFFGVRRQVPGPAFVPGDFLAAGWKDHPPRTAVFGIAGGNVRGIIVQGPDGHRRLNVAPNRAFLAVYGPTVRPSDLTVRVTLRDGTVKTHRGDTNLIADPRRHP